MCHIHIFHNEVWRMIKNDWKVTKLSHYLSYMLGEKHLNFTALCSEMGGFIATNMQKQQAWLPLTKAQSYPEPSYYEVTEQITASAFLKLLRFGYFKRQSQMIQEDQRLYTRLSSVCCCTHAALASCNTSSRLRRLPLLRTQEKTGRNDAGSEKRGQEGLSTLVFSPDIICTWAHPLWLMSHITSAVCSQEVSHSLSLRCKRHYLAHPLLTVPQRDTGGAVVSARYVRIHSSKK